jgi:branched-chain amino acid transport system ATP-binding protein
MVGEMNSTLQNPSPEKTPDNNFAIELRGINKRFGALVALEDISFQVRPGERRAVLGSNGAGKTTLFNCITGDFNPTEGSIRFFGEDVTEYPAHDRIRRGLRRTYQISLLFTGLTVRDNIYLACRGVSNGRFSILQRGSKEPQSVATEELLEVVKLQDQRNMQVSDLAYGQQRQLEIALALVGAPRFILFDEPAAGLSPRERRELINILNQMPKHIGYIIIEHDMDVALSVSEYVTMMHNGRIFKEGNPEQIENDAEVQALYLGGANE